MRRNAGATKSKKKRCCTCCCHERTASPNKKTKKGGDEFVPFALRDPIRRRLDMIGKYRNYTAMELYPVLKPFYHGKKWTEEEIDALCTIFVPVASIEDCPPEDVEKERLVDVVRHALNELLDNRADLMFYMR